MYFVNVPAQFDALGISKKEKEKKKVIPTKVNILFDSQDCTFNNIHLVKQ